MFAEVAQAAPYTVWACADGSGHGLDAGDWRPYRHPGDPLSHVDSTCGNPAPGELGRLQAIAQATAYTPYQPVGGVGWTAVAAPATVITAFDVWWARHINPESQPPWGLLTVETENNLLDVQNTGLLGAFSPVSPAIAYGVGNHQGFRDLAAQSIKLEVMCQNWCDRVGNTVAGTFSAYRLRLTLDDQTVPAGMIDGLTDGARIEGPVALSARASDVGGGVREIVLRVDGATVDSVVAGERCADVDPSNTDPNEYVRVKPCPDTLEGTLTLRPEHLATNEGHWVTVVAVDAAGQRSVIGEARVARAAPAGFFAGDAGFVNPDLNVSASRSVNGSNGGPARVQLSFVVARKRGSRVIRRFVGRQVVDYGHRALYRGRLTTVDGRPIVGARVWRAVAPRGQGWRLSGPPLITSKTGSVVGRTPVRGGNREMQLVYFPYTDTNEHGMTPPRSLRVRASTTIQLDQSGYRNGDLARFSGRVVSGPVIPRKVVYLQALVRRQWRTFDTTRADARGRWRLHYRFSATRRFDCLPLPRSCPSRGALPLEYRPIARGASAGGAVSGDEN